MAAFRVLLALLVVAVTVLVVRFLVSGQRSYLRWAARLLGVALASALVFFAVLLVERLA